MKTLLAASLLFAPVLLHAQAITPAQLRGDNGPVLNSKLVAPAFAASSMKTPSAPLRISTGVVAPVIVSTVPVVSDSAWFSPDFAGNRQITVALVVDEKGVPIDLKVIATSHPEFNRNVLEAVGKFRFTPGTLNNVPTEVPVTLTVNVSHDGN